MMTHGVCRYGDYFGAATDPSDSRVVWVAGETMTAAGWSTTIAELGTAPVRGISLVTIILIVAVAVAAGILLAYMVTEIWDRISS